MAQDFSYRGVHISRFGFHYAPETPDWHIWEPQYKTNETSSKTKDGGQWNSSTVNIKEFTLRMYFENITEGQLFNGTELFNRLSEGELIFDERPWLVYTVRPYKEVTIEKYKSKVPTISGIMTVYLRAYYPFAISRYASLDDNTVPVDVRTRFREITGYLPATRVPTNTAGTKTAQFIYNTYNAGNANADTVIRIAGDTGAGVDIYNPSTGQYCRVIGLTAALTTNVSRWLEIHSATGEVFLTNGTTRTNGFKYHTRGYVQIAPNTPVRRDLSVTYNGTTLSSPTASFNSGDVGKTILLGTTWHKIVSVTNTSTAIITPTKAGPATVTTDISSINQLVVTPVSTMSLTRFEVISQHTFY